MSADNYGIIKHVGEEFVVGMFFSSCDYSPFEVDEEFTLSDARFPTLYEAVVFCQESEFEYGWQYHDALEREISEAMSNHPSRIKEKWNA